MPAEVTSEDIKNSNKLSFGFDSKTYTSAATDLAMANMYIYAIQPLGGNATIASAKGLDGIAISELAGIVYTQDVIYTKQLLSINFTSLTAVEVYFKSPKQ